MSTARLSTKGRLVIPSKFRKALGLQPGDQVELKLEGERLIVQRADQKRAKLIQGKFGRVVLTAPPGAPVMTNELMKTLLEDFP